MSKDKSNKAKIKIKPNKIKLKRKTSLRDFMQFMGRTFIIAMFIIYLVIGVMGTTLWWKSSAHRSLDMNNLAKRIMDYRQGGKDVQALFTAHIQKISRSDEVVEQLLPIIPELETPFFFEMSRRYVAMYKMDEALFWHMLGRFHARYDMFRCVGIPNTKFFDYFLSLETEPNLVAYMQGMEKEKIKNTMLRVIEWDKNNPPKGKPDYFCGFSKLYYGSEEISGDVQIKETWPIILEKLREEMQESLEKLSEIEEQE